MNLEDAIDGGDAEFMCVMGLIALHRAGRIEPRDVPRVFDKLIDAPFGSAITIEVEDDEEADEADDAGPPVRSSNESESTSGSDSTASSETLHQRPHTTLGLPTRILRSPSP